MKVKTLLMAHDGTKKLNEGEGVVAIQGNKDENGIMVNMDWSFDKSWTMTEIKSFFGGFLGNLEDIFGEKMVTEAINHWGTETGKIVKDKSGKFLWLRSKGLDFKK